MKHIGQLVAAALTLAFAIGFAGCGRRETLVAAGDREQVLYRGVGYEVADLDPQTVTGIAEQTITSSLFEGLVRESAQDGAPVPGVADSWEMNPDRIHYRFHLRGDARWSDGSPVTAQDFLASWKRLLTPSLGAKNAQLLYVLQGAEAYHRGISSDFATVGVAAPDVRTLEVTLEHPAPYFLSLLCQMPWLPVPMAVIGKSGPVDRPGSRWTRPGNLVGNGPFVLKSWDPDRAIIVERSLTYWDAKDVRLHAIHFLPIDSMEGEERAFRAGQLQITDALPPARMDAYRGQSPPVLRVDPFLATYFFRFNTRKAALADPLVRRALALAVDRRAIVDRVLRGGQTVAYAFTPPGLDGYSPDPLQKTDFAAARALLAKAGHAGGAGVPVLQLSYNNSEAHRLVAEAVQGTWQRELGVRVTLANQENKTLFAAMSTGDYDIVKSDWVADYADPTSFLDIFRSSSGNNRTGWSDRDYDQWLFAADRTADAAERRALWRKAEDRLLEEAPIACVYYYAHAYLLRPSVRGWSANPLDHHPYQEVWLQPEGTATPP